VRSTNTAKTCTAWEINFIAGMIDGERHGWPADIRVREFPEAFQRLEA
jgi:hypothetical protein